MGGAAPAAPARMSLHDLRTGRVAAAAAVLAIAGAALLWRSLRREEPHAALAAAPAAAILDARVVAADRDVERTAPGGWTPARSGDVLRAADAIRTGTGATAEVALGRGALLTVAERSELSVQELTEAAQRVRLHRGRVGVEVSADGARVLRVEDASGAVAATMTAGRFGVVAAGTSLAVAASEGLARVESAGAAVEVPPGTQTVAWRGAAPLAPRPIPRELVLRVARQLERRRARACVVLQVDLASEVTVDGEPAEVHPDGTVIVLLPPDRRRHGAQVVVRHASGAVERRTLPCWEDEGEVSDLEVRWDER